MTEVAKLHNHLKSLSMPVVLCHNDNQWGNIIYNSDKEIVRLIDFEWTSYNYQASDIALHFAYFTGTLPPDFSSYPDEDFQKKWLREYLRHWLGYRQRGQQGDVSAVQLERLYVQVNKCYLFMCLSAGVMGPVFDASGVVHVDMLEYGIRGVREYFRIKDKVMALQLPPENE